MDFFSSGAWNSKEGQQVYLKSTPPWMFSSYKTSKGKNKDFARQNKFFAMPMPMPTSMLMLMPRCRYRDFQMVNIYPLQKKIPEIKSQYVFNSLNNIFVRSKAVSRKETYIYRCFQSELQKPLFWGILGKKCSENMPFNHED